MATITSSLLSSFSPLDGPPEAEVEATVLRQEQAADEAASLKAAAAREAASGYAVRKARRKVLAGKSSEIASFLQRQSVADQLDARTRQVL